MNDKSAALLGLFELEVERPGENGRSFNLTRQHLTTKETSNYDSNRNCP